MTTAQHIVAAAWSLIATVGDDLNPTKAENDGPIGRSSFHANIQIVPTPTCGGTASGCIITPSICMARAQAGSGLPPRPRLICLD